MIRTPVWQYRAMCEWVKTVYLSELLPSEDAHVVQLGVADGVDLGKFARAHVAQLVAVDTRDSLDRLHEKWESRK